MEPNDLGQRFDLIIRGRVQGVGFRWWVARHATRLGVRGSIRNRPDGSVEVHAAGASQPLMQLRRLLDEGPPASRIDSVTDVSPSGHLFEGFRIEN